MVQPVLLAIDDDETLLGDIERELHDRYARHYQVVCVRSPAEARAHLTDFAASGVEVALVLAARSAAEVPASELLAEVRQVHPWAKRALVVAFGDWGQKAVGDEIFEGVADGRFDHYVLRPAAARHWVADRSRGRGERALPPDRSTAVVAVQAATRTDAHSRVLTPHWAATARTEVRSSTGRRCYASSRAVIRAGARIHF